jgi:hypothetical protein
MPIGDAAVAVPTDPMTEEVLTDNEEELPFQLPFNR